MRVHLYLYTVAGRTREEQERFLAKIDQQVTLAAKNGFSGVWMPEHHAAGNFFPPPFQFLTWVAARHPGLHVGTAIAIAPLMHPLHMAEAVATLDWVSGGRAMFGFGTGFREAEFGAFGVHLGERFSLSREILGCTSRLLAGEKVSFDTGPWRGTDATMKLQAIQSPRPPFLWAVINERGVRTAAAVADGVLPSSLADFDHQIRFLEAYDEATGRAAPVRPVMADVVVADTQARANERAVRRLANEYGSFKHWRAVVPDLDAFLRDPAGQVEAIKSRAFVGTPDHIENRLQGFEQKGVTDVLLRLEQASTEPDEVLEGIEAIGAKLLPRYQLP
jgi:alkanesulfonate monooxygenase SsuD/methylene tetrahydromethanopterin reductase-like flavin-dependent oxidoreductase (luciferase family)